MLSLSRKKKDRILYKSLFSLYRFITNRYLRIDKTQDVEWGYAFDIHMNAVFPALIILHILQLFFYNGEIMYISWFACGLGNV